MSSFYDLNIMIEQTPPPPPGAGGLGLGPPPMGGSLGGAGMPPPLPGMGGGMGGSMSPPMGPPGMGAVPGQPQPPPDRIDLDDVWSVMDAKLKGTFKEKSKDKEDKTARQNQRKDVNSLEQQPSELSQPSAAMDVPPGTQPELQHLQGIPGM